jgi:hypothetical protein
MAQQQVGNVHGVAAKNANSGQQRTNMSGSTANQQSGYFDADQADIAAMRARLNAISGTTYTTAVLNKMTANDMAYAIRRNDAPGTL